MKAIATSSATAATFAITHDLPPFNREITKLFSQALA